MIDTPMVEEKPLTPAEAKEKKEKESKMVSTPNSNFANGSQYGTTATNFKKASYHEIPCRRTKKSK